LRRFEMSMAVLEERGTEVQFEGKWRWRAGHLAGRFCRIVE
jgi:hypothetical protein